MKVPKQNATEKTSILGNKPGKKHLAHHSFQLSLLSLKPIVQQHPQRGLEPTTRSSDESFNLSPNIEQYSPDKY